MWSHYIPTKLLRVRAGSFANCTVQIKRCTYLAKTTYFSCAEDTDKVFKISYYSLFSCITRSTIRRNKLILVNVQSPWAV